jgi:hypothetical protein
MRLRPNQESADAESQDWSPWNVGTLAAAVALFLLGVGGLLAVFPYSEPTGINALFVTSPSVTPAAKPAVAVKSATGNPESPTASSSVAEDTPAPLPVEATEEAVEEATVAPPVVLAASQQQAPVATIADIPTPAPTAAPTEAPTEVPTPAPTATPTEEPTVEPTATAQPEVADDKPAPGEHPRSDPKKPVTAFIDNDNTGAQSSERQGGVSSAAQAVPPPPTN